MTPNQPQEKHEKHEKAGVLTVPPSVYIYIYIYEWINVFVIVLSCFLVPRRKTMQKHMENTSKVISRPETHDMRSKSEFRHVQWLSRSAGPVQWLSRKTSPCQRGRLVSIFWEISPVVLLWTNSWFPIRIQNSIKEIYDFRLKWPCIKYLLICYYNFITCCINSFVLSSFFVFSINLCLSMNLWFVIEMYYLS